MKIEYRKLGPVIARANHETNVIELNEDIYPKLPPYVREFVMCHELVHLEYEIWDENRTNEIAVRVFLNNAKSADDLEARREFVSHASVVYDTDSSDSSNYVGAIIGAVVTIGTTVWGSIKANRDNNPFLKLSTADQKALCRNLLDQSFQQADKNSDLSAKMIFESLIAPYYGKGYSKFCKKYKKWFPDMVAEYEQKYGRGFEEVRTVSLWSYTPFRVAIVVAVAALVAFAAVKIAKKMKK